MSNKTIDLRSDTVTKPTPAMLDAMFSAEVGDDVFGEDPTINKLEEKGAEMLGAEAALFCPSGTMTNQIAVRVHVRPGDEVICDRTAHIYNYEGGGVAANSGASIKLVHGDRGIMTPEMVLKSINKDDAHLANTSLVSVENTSNKGGGSIYSLAQMKALSETARDNKLKIHLDGARVFNALVELDEPADSLGKLFDSISICLSKGLGTPLGSLLVGSKEFIGRSRRMRKLMGGGMRQAGYVAAAGIYALDNNVTRLKEDHARARQIASAMESLGYIESILPVDTNILIFKLDADVSQEKFMKHLEDNGVRTVSLDPQMIRMVTHLEIDDEMTGRTIAVLKAFN
ncbi:MAG: low-specificity L-threonine aldolase [Flavobacteriales bacterium]|nr:low-specificity L-threonine aldolase [Flavobacteriales bacterium]